jgi:hypothetical protein
MLKPGSLAASCLFVALQSGNAVPVHVWEKQELTFTSARSYVNPYTEVVLWIARKSVLYLNRRTTMRSNLMVIAYRRALYRCSASHPRPDLPAE